MIQCVLMPTMARTSDMSSFQKQTPRTLKETIVRAQPRVVGVPTEQHLEKVVKNADHKVPSKSTWVRLSECMAHRGLCLKKLSK
jgi:hypothetical protein